MTYNFSYEVTKYYNMTNPLKEFRPESLCLLKDNQDLWCYTRRGPQDFSIYTEKSAIYETPDKNKYKVGADVLVRWTDGLYYLGVILQVEEEFSRCVVHFEDKTNYWALYKDIVKGCQTEFTCYICDSATSEPPDEIVICDKCSIGYHQSCHVPKISASDLNPELPWMCRTCIFTLTVRLGGAAKKGSNARALMLMKQFLPYELESLTWDSTHRSNLQQLYCYCGGPGEWVRKMLQCTRCQQWFHEACLQCLEKPLLLGDRFYIFVCSMCNKGPEFLRRMPMRWIDVAHLVLYNITITYGRKYYDFEKIIMPYLKENWHLLQLTGEMFSGLSTEKKRENFLEALRSSKSRFAYGKRKNIMKKKFDLWGLKSRMAPQAPVVTLPNVPTITNEVLDSYSKSRKSKSLTINHWQPTSIPSPVKQASKVPSVDDDIIIINSPAKDDIEVVPPILEPKQGRIFRSREVRSVPVDQEQEENNENKRKAEKPPEEKQVNELKKKKLEKPLPSSEEDEESLESVRSHISSRTHLSTKSQKSKLSQKPQRKLPHRKAKDFIKPNGTRKLPTVPPILIDISENDDTTSSFGTLNAIIPHPTDFEGPNNPFMNNDAQSSTSSTSVCSTISDSKNRSRLRKRKCAKMGAINSRKFTPNKNLIKGLFNQSLANNKVQPLSTLTTSRSDLSSSVSNHLELGDCIPNGNGGKFTIVGKRLGSDNKVQYLVQWDNLNHS